MFLGIVECSQIYVIHLLRFSATAVYWAVGRAVHRAAWSAVAVHHWDLHGSATGDWELQKAATGATGWGCADSAAICCKV